MRSMRTIQSRQLQLQQSIQSTPSLQSTQSQQLTRSVRPQRSTKSIRSAQSLQLPQSTQLPQSLQLPLSTQSLRPSRSMQPLQLSQPSRSMQPSKPTRSMKLRQSSQSIRVLQKEKRGRKKSTRIKHIKREFSGSHPIHCILKTAINISFQEYKSIRIIRGLFSEMERRYTINIFQYFVNKNHIHLFLYSPWKESLSKAMQFLSSKLALYFNKQLRRRGKFWFDRYFGAVCQADNTGEISPRSRQD